jgi:hypothetical protein
MTEPNDNQESSNGGDEICSDRARPAVAGRIR